MAPVCIPSGDPYSHLLKCLPGRLERQQWEFLVPCAFSSLLAGALLPSCPAPQPRDSWHVTAHSSDQTFIFVVKQFGVFFSEQWDSQCTNSRSPLFRAITCLPLSTTLAIWLWAFCFTKNIAKSLARITWGIIFVCWRTSFQKGKGSRHSI